jgi:two-component system CheB/CheR fusion protein
MPASAVAEGCVDFVLPPEQIGQELGRLAGHPYLAPAAAEEAEGKAATETTVFEEILAILRVRAGVDFTHYKRPTLLRRIQRRMLLQRVKGLREYVRYLREHPTEQQELFNDILIHVTEFFRDASVFQLLKKKVFPRLLKGKGPEDPVRIWVPGCSTGEEVYSIAIALSEFFDQKRGSSRPIQIFATDINTYALDKARSGVYPETINVDVSTERLRRFFTKTDGGFRISKALREMCIFARQNVVTDPPFSNLDLISCRNVLIYLGGVLQRKVLPIFHYALKPQGYLLLGASETIGSSAELFALADKRNKLYTKRDVETRPPLSFSHGDAGPMPEGAVPPAKAARPEVSITDVQRQADRLVLTHYSPNGIVINKNLEVLQFRGRTADYLEHAHGEASLHLLKMAREDILMELRALTQKAIRGNARVRKEGVRVPHNDHALTCTIDIVPFAVPPSAERYYLVLFTETKHPTKAEDARAGGRTEKARTPKEQAMRHEVGRLREELAATRESLQAIIEEQDATNEELRSANEEIMSSNEELQSTNEELETAKEELQSTNEELTTLNDELENRAVELDRVNNDMHNLLSSSHIPIVLIGPDLKIRRFTTVAQKMFNLIPTDIGRPITDINLPVGIPSLGKLVSEVVDSLASKDVEVQCDAGHWYSLRLRPYRTSDNKIDGAVLSLVDIHLLRLGLDQSRAVAEAVMSTVRHPLLMLDGQLRVTTANPAFYRTFGITAQETLSIPIYELGSGAWNAPGLHSLLEEMLPADGSVESYRLEHSFPQLGPRTLLLSARRLMSDAILLAFEDATGGERR